MKIQKEQKDTCRILLLEGRLDADAAATLSPYLGVEEDEKASTLIIDLSQVQYLSSGGIRALHSAYKAWKNRGGQVILSGVGEFPRKVLAMSGFDRIFPQYPTVETLSSQSMRGGPLKAMCLLTGKYMSNHWRRILKFQPSGAPDPLHACLYPAGGIHSSSHLLSLNTLFLSL